MDKKEKGIKPISGMPMLGIDEDGNLNIDIDAAKKEYYLFIIYQIMDTKMMDTPI